MGTAENVRVYPDGLEKLRAKFPADSIGKLPRVTCRDCSDRAKTCTKHQKSKCNICGNYISSAHIHLDYVGHAAVTDRLLTVDPEWSWEPVAFDAEGAPLVKRDGREARMWVRLTVCGVTRLGVGIALADSFELEKQLIGDAIRNAAMRFGVALDLWSKEELPHEGDEDRAEGGGERPNSRVDRGAEPGDSAAPAPALPLEPSALGDIDAMRAKELVEALAARNLEAGGTVPEMRERLRGAA